MRKIYIVYDRSSRRIVNHINSAIFSAADCFPATDFTFMGTSFRGVNIDDIVEHAESRVMSGRV